MSCGMLCLSSMRVHGCMKFNLIFCNYFTDYYKIEQKNLTNFKNLHVSIFIFDLRHSFAIFTINKSKISVN